MNLKNCKKNLIEKIREKKAQTPKEVHQVILGAFWRTIAGNSNQRLLVDDYNLFFIRHESNHVLPNP